MSTSNGPARLLSFLLLAALLAASCAREESASLHRDVRLDMAHDPPGVAPAGQPFVLALRVTSEPPLASGSVHLWYDAGSGWVRLQLAPLEGSDRFEAEIPEQPRGRRLRYYFVVRSPLGDDVRLPKGWQEGSAAPDETLPGAAPPDLAAPAPPAAPGTTAPAESARGPAPHEPTAEPVPGSTAGEGDFYRLLVRAPVAPWALWLRALGGALGLLVVGGGALLTARRRDADGARRPSGLRVEAAGVVLFVLLGLGGAAAASFQSTGNPVLDVPLAWWVALAAWLPLLLIARAVRRVPAGGSRRGPRLALLGAILAVPGAVCVAWGLAQIL